MHQTPASTYQGCSVGWHEQTVREPIVVGRPRAQVCALRCGYDFLNSATARAHPPRIASCLMSHVGSPVVSQPVQKKGTAAVASRRLHSETIPIVLETSLRRHCRWVPRLAPARNIWSDNEGKLQKVDRDRKSVV